MKKIFVCAGILLLYAGFAAGSDREIGSIEMVYIEGGTFMLGSPESEKDRFKDEKQHRVTVSPFWIGKYEVTQEQYKEVMRNNPSGFKGENLPVECVSWEEAMEFCRRFSEKYNVKARLPYEAEWEYACRGGTDTRYFWGNEINGDYAWYDANSDNRIHPVGTKKPNPFGLYDMSGNVFEWCMDWFSDTYYLNSPINNPTGAPGGRTRVLRGGSWDHSGRFMRSAARDGYIPGHRSLHYGFRVVVPR